MGKSSDEIRLEARAQGWAPREKWCLLFNYDNL